MSIGDNNQLLYQVPINPYAQPKLNNSLLNSAAGLASATSSTWSGLGSATSTWYTYEPGSYNGIKIQENDYATREVQIDYPYSGAKRLRTIKFFRVNEEITLDEDSITDPVDRLRVKVAKWLRQET